MMKKISSFLLVAVAGVLFTLSWTLTPRFVSAGVLGYPSSLPAGSGTPTPTPTPPDHCTDAINGYSDECRGKVESNPSVSIPATTTQNFYLSGPNASIELAVDRVTGNRPPVAVSKEEVTFMEWPLAVTLEGSDPDGDAVDFAISVYPLNGSLSRSGAEVTYTPNPGFQGKDAFAYHATDGRRKGGAVVTISVGDVANGAPVIGALDQSMAFGTVLNLSATVTDTEGDVIDMVVVDDETRGVIEGDVNAFTYTPGVVFGQDQFYLVADENSGGLQRTITLVTIQVGTPPAQTSVYVGDPDDGGSQISSTVDGYGPARVTGINTLVLGDGPQMIYAKSVDGAGRLAKVAAQFEIDNQPPTLQWDQKPNQTFIRDSLTLGVQAADNTRVQSVKFEVEAGGRLQRSEFLTQLPYLKQNYDVRGLPNGEVTFRFYAIDNAGNVSETLPATYTIDNSAPQVSLVANSVMVNPAGAPVILSGNTSLQFVATDAGAGLTLLQARLGGETTPRISSPTSPVTTRWDTKLIANGATSIVLRGVDAVGNESIVTFSNLVIRNNTAPVAANQSLTMTEDGQKNITLTAQDFDDPSGASLQYSIHTAPRNGTLAGTPPAVRYEPAPGFDGIDSFVFSVTDGSLSSTGRIDLTITGVNNPPVAQPIDLPVSMDGFVIIDPRGNDPEKKKLTFEIVTPPTHGQIEVLPNGSWKYVPEPNYVGPDEIVYKANDGSVDSEPVKISLTIDGTPVNHAPTAVAKTISIEMGQSANVMLEGSDPDGDVLTFGVAAQPLHGQLSGTEPNLVYTPTAGYKGPDSFSYTANDGVTPSVAVLVNLTVIDTTPPTVSNPVPADGATLSGVFLLSIDADDNDDIQSVQILIDGALVAVITDEPYQYSLDTTSLAVGGHTVTFRIIDGSGNVVDRPQQVTVERAVGPGAPTIELTNPVSQQLLSGYVQVLARTTGGVSSLNVNVGNVVLPMSPAGPDRYSLTWNTGEEITSGQKKFLDGAYVLVARAVGPQGDAETSVNVTVDNTPPTFKEWVFPNGDRANRLYGRAEFRINAEDINGIDHVDFWFGNQKYVVPIGVNNKEFTYLLDTTPYSENTTYSAQAVIVDRAGNETTSPPRTFRVVKTPPSSEFNIDPHPRDASYVTSAVDSQISAYVGSIKLPIAPDAIKVFVTQNGQEKSLVGGTSYNNGVAKFSGAVPANSEVRWVIDVLDANEQQLSGQFTFSRMMSKADGGDVFIDVGTQGRFQITVPRGAFSEDMMVMIENDPTVTNNTISEGHRSIAGPFRTFGRNAAHAEIKDLSEVATLLYYDLEALPAGEQNRAIQIQKQDDTTEVWRPVGISDIPLASNVSGKLGTRSVSVPINSFGTFRVNSVPVAAAGIDGLFAFPNPFSPNEGGTSFQYSLSSNSDVDIVVYDLFGNLVRTMHWPAGSVGGQVSSTPPWDGRNGEGEIVANGGYIVQIVARDAAGKVSKAKYKVGVIK